MDGVSALTRPSWLWIAVLAATLVVAPVLAWQLAPVDPREREARALERALRCPVCEGQSVADSNSAVALEMRQEIRRLLAEGRSRDEILQSFADRYGAWVVYMPPRHGWYLLGWAGPFLAVAAGAGVLAWWWRGRRPASQGTPQAAPAGAWHPGASSLSGDEPAPPARDGKAARLESPGGGPEQAAHSATGGPVPAAGDPVDDDVRRWM